MIKYKPVNISLPFKTTRIARAIAINYTPGMNPLVSNSETIANRVELFLERVIEKMCYQRNSL